MASTNAAEGPLLPDAEQELIPTDELSNPELNPLLNPVLDQNMGLWAQVYITSPPDKRQQAVADLLHELHGQRKHNGTQVSSDSPPRTIASRRQRPKICPACQVSNDTGNKFCCLCGGRLAPVDGTQTSTPDVETPIKLVRQTFPGTDGQRSRANAVGRIGAAWSPGRLGSTFVFATLILLALGSFAYREWGPSLIGTVPGLSEAKSNVHGSPASGPAVHVGDKANGNRPTSSEVSSQPATATSFVAATSKSVRQNPDLLPPAALVSRNVFSGRTGAPETGSEPGSTLPRLQVAEIPEGHLNYPASPQEGLAGTVHMRLLIGTRGQVRRALVLSGNQRLAEAAVRAVLLWQYSPHLLNGQPVEAQTDVSISFFGEDAVSINFLPLESVGPVEVHSQQ